MERRRRAIGILYVKKNISIDDENDETQKLFYDDDE